MVCANWTTNGPCHSTPQRPLHPLEKKMDSLEMGIYHPIQASC